jgi:chromosome segregation protein
LETTRTELQEATRARSELGRQTEQLRNDGLDCLRERAARQNELASLQSDCRALDAQGQRHTRRREEIARLLGEVEQRKVQNVAEMGLVEKDMASARARFAARAEERGELRAQIESSDEEIALQRNALAARSSRRDVLRDLEVRGEGVEAGTQRLLERSAEGQAIHGMVADLVQVDTPYARAIEAALGGAVQHLVADTLDAAAEAVSHLKSTDGGHSTLLALDRLGANGHNGHEKPDHPSVIGRALDLVRYEEQVGPAVRHLLGDTYVVSDLGSAVEIARTSESDIRLATLEGDILHPRGFISGGSERDRVGLLSRKNELRVLTGEVEEIERRVEQLRTQRDHFISESAVLDTELEETRQQLDELNLRLASVREQASRLADREKDLTDESLVIEAELAAFQSELQQRRARAETLAVALRATDEAEHDIKSRLEVVERDRVAADDQRIALERRMADLSIQRARTGTEQDHVRVTIERLKGELANARSAEEHGAAELAALAQRYKTALGEIAAKEAEIRDLLQRSDAVAAERVAAENARAELMALADQLTAQLRDARGALRDQEQQAQRLRLDLHDQELRLGSLAEKIRDEHRQDVRQLYAEYQEPEADWEEVQAAVDDLKRKIEGMGTVNLLAIEEQDELEVRHDFLASQEQDLLRAKQALQEVIRKVNRRSRQLFEQTFAAVRENFQAIYRKLFGGGKADILLEADQDVLEAGVEIIAKPPGKEPSTIRLLSGGEKSMTAVALLLAIFKSKPSPFCILDEVDAALDEANIGRFVGILKEFLEQSQFLIVTHSKQTMSVADMLYGITMQEAGVSSPIAVKLDEIEEFQRN